MLLTQKIVNSVSESAKESARSQMNNNLHFSPEHAAQRMFNAI